MSGIYFIGGSEPYLVDCQKISLIGKFSVRELNYMESTSFTEEVFQFLHMYPIGDDRKVVYITVGNLSEMDTPLFREYQKNPSVFGRLVIRFLAYDARRTFYKELKKEGLLQLFDKESATLKLSEFIEKRAAKKGVSFSDKEALALFLERENYANREDITLYNLMGDLNNLIALGNPITQENICLVVPDNVKDNVFGIAGQIVKRDIFGLRTQAALCKGNEIATLSALLREYRIAYKAFYFPLSDIGATRNVLRGMDKEVLVNGIHVLTDAIDAVKSGGVPLSIVLEQTFMKLVNDMDS